MSTIADIKSTAEQKMAGCIDAFKNNLTKIRTGRAHSGLLDHIMVDYYGNMTPLNQVANVSLIDSRTIGVQVWEKSMAGKVERAIRESDLGLNPAAAGDVLRIPMPALTEERRRDLTKVVRTEGESAKIVARNIRRDANEGLKKLLKEKAVSEDDERRAQDDVQKLTDRVINDIDRLVTAKEAEVMAV
jgi:ribosome recycling factor